MSKQNNVAHIATDKLVAQHRELNKEIDGQHDHRAYITGAVQEKKTMRAHVKTEIMHRAIEGDDTAVAYALEREWITPAQADKSWEPEVLEGDHVSPTIEPPLSSLHEAAA